MTFRFILATGDGDHRRAARRRHDARLGRTPYVWRRSGVRGSEERSGRLWEGIISTARILILGVVMDIIYQWMVLDTFYPGQSAVIAILLAFVPYLAVARPHSSASRIVGSPGRHPS